MGSGGCLVIIDHHHLNLHLVEAFPKFFPYPIVNLRWVQTNPLICWYQWDYLRSPAKNLSFFAGYQRLRLATDFPLPPKKNGESPRCA